jgi:alkylation response protein AidB-like acyl-CoA dehydrogenase
MDFEYTVEQEQFRSELREFIEQRLPPSWGGIFGAEAEREIPLTQQICQDLAGRGWLTMAWPAEYGGQDLDLWTQMILREEMWGHGEPRGPQYMNLNYIGPMIMKYGTSEQKDRFLPPMSAGKVLWTQGFSEPEAGSDLASLRTRADDYGDHFLVNGQKIWNSYAGAAEWCLLLVRTDFEVPKHAGLSVLLVDMRSPGVTVRPIESMAGFGEINEIFLHDVRVPRANLLGNKNEGWPIVLYGLRHERTGIALHGRVLATIRRIIEYARTTTEHGERVGDDPVIRNAIADAYCRYRAARLMSYRVTSMLESGVEPAAEAPMAWIHGALALQTAANVGMDVIGANAVLLQGERDSPLDGKMEREWVETLPFSLGPGTIDIQRLIVAQQGLGLPRAN